MRPVTSLRRVLSGIAATGLIFTGFYVGAPTASAAPSATTELNATAQVASVDYDTGTTIDITVRMCNYDGTHTCVAPVQFVNSKTEDTESVTNEYLLVQNNANPGVWSPVSLSGATATAGGTAALGANATASFDTGPLSSSSTFTFAIGLPDAQRGNARYWAGIANSQTQVAYYLPGATTQVAVTVGPDPQASASPTASATPTDSASPSDSSSPSDNPNPCDSNPSDPSCNPNPCDSNPSDPSCNPNPCDSNPSDPSCNQSPSDSPPAEPVYINGSAFSLGTHPAGIAFSHPVDLGAAVSGVDWTSGSSIVPIDLPANLETDFASNDGDPILTISGTPSVGSGSFTVAVEDNSGATIGSATATYDFTNNATTSTSKLPIMTMIVGQAPTHTVAPSDFAAGFNWSMGGELTIEGLPAGLSYQPTPDLPSGSEPTVDLVGFPMSSAEIWATVTATDAFGNTATTTLPLLIENRNTSSFGGGLWPNSLVYYNYWIRFGSTSSMATFIDGTLVEFKPFVGSGSDSFLIYYSDLAKLTDPYSNHTLTIRQYYDGQFAGAEPTFDDPAAVTASTTFVASTSELTQDYSTIDAVHNSTQRYTWHGPNGRAFAVFESGQDTPVYEGSIDNGGVWTCSWSLFSLPDASRTVTFVVYDEPFDPAANYTLTADNILASAVSIFVPTPTFSAPTNINFTQGQAVTAKFDADGLTKNMDWSNGGYMSIDHLPAGVYWDSVNRWTSNVPPAIQLRGTPSYSGYFHATLTVQDSTGSTYDVSFDFYVSPPPSLTPSTYSFGPGDPTPTISISNAVGDTYEIFIDGRYTSMGEVQSNMVIPVNFPSGTDLAISHTFAVAVYPVAFATGPDPIASPEGALLYGSINYAPPLVVNPPRLAPFEVGVPYDQVIDVGAITSGFNWMDGGGLYLGNLPDSIHVKLLNAGETSSEVSAPGEAPRIRIFGTPTTADDVNVDVEVYDLIAGDVDTGWTVTVHPQPTATVDPSGILPGAHTTLTWTGDIPPQSVTAFINGEAVKTWELDPEQSSLAIAYSDFDAIGDPSKTRTVELRTYNAWQSSGGTTPNVGDAFDATTTLSLTTTTAAGLSPSDQTVNPGQNGFLTFTGDTGLSMAIYTNGGFSGYMSVDSWLHGPNAWISDPTAQTFTLPYDAFTDTKTTTWTFRVFEAGTPMPSSFDDTTGMMAEASMTFVARGVLNFDKTTIKSGDSSTLSWDSPRTITHVAGFIGDSRVYSSTTLPTDATSLGINWSDISRSTDINTERVVQFRTYQDADWQAADGDVTTATTYDGAATLTFTPYALAEFDPTLIRPGQTASFNHEGGPDLTMCIFAPQVSSTPIQCGTNAEQAIQTLSYDDIVAGMSGHLSDPFIIEFRIYDRIYQSGDTGDIDLTTPGVLSDATLTLAAGNTASFDIQHFGPTDPRATLSWHGDNSVARVAAFNGSQLVYVSEPIPSDGTRLTVPWSLISENTDITSSRNIEFRTYTTDEWANLKGVDPTSTDGFDASATLTFDAAAVPALQAPTIPSLLAEIPVSKSINFTDLASGFNWYNGGHVDVTGLPDGMSTVLENGNMGWSYENQAPTITLVGAPTTAGSYTATFVLTDDYHNTATVDVPITVTPLATVSLDAPTMQQMRVGTAFSQTITVPDNAVDWNFSLGGSAKASALPNGITATISNTDESQWTTSGAPQLLISGTPTQAGTGSFTWTVYSRSGQKGTVQVPYTVVTSSVPTSPPGQTIRGNGVLTFDISGVTVGSIVTPGDPVRGISGITIVGSRVKATVARGFSGLIRQPIVVTNGDTETIVYLTIKVLPSAVTHATFTIKPGATVIHWTPSANAYGYRVLVGSRIVCTTKAAASACTTAGVYGPRSAVKIVALGGNNLTAVSGASYTRPGTAVSMGYILFGPDSAVLTPASKKQLHNFVTSIAQQGFTQLTVSGFAAHFAANTSAADKAHRIALAKARAEVVRTFLRAEFKKLGVSVSITAVGATNGHSIVSGKVPSGVDGARRAEYGVS